MHLRANYSDGLTAARVETTVTLGEDGFHLPSGDLWAFGDVVLVSQGRNLFTYRHTQNSAPRLTLILQDAGPEDVAEFLAKMPKSLVGGSIWFELRWQGVMALAIFGLMVAIYFSYPYANRLLVAFIPGSWAENAGEVVLDNMYGDITGGRCYRKEGVAALAKMQSKLDDGRMPYPLKIKVVKNPMVNAMTAPGGNIVIFNGLIQKASSADEVAGILAHEMGHVYYKHPLQAFVNVVGFSIIGQVFGGDAGTIAIFMMGMSYSRDAERQADTKALELLYRAKISEEGFHNFFETVKKEIGDKIPENMLRFMSTHPIPDDRQKFIREQRKNKDENGFQPALSDSEWQALKSICVQPKDAS